MSRSQAQVELTLPGLEPLPRHGLSASSSASTCADPRYSTLRDPRREGQTIWTATAPESRSLSNSYSEGAGVGQLLPILSGRNDTGSVGLVRQHTGIADSVENVQARALPGALDLKTSGR
jgi:hypothetical protein